MDPAERNAIVLEHTKFLSRDFNSLTVLAKTPLSQRQPSGGAKSRTVDIATRGTQRSSLEAYNPVAKMGQMEHDEVLIPIVLTRFDVQSAANMYRNRQFFSKLTELFDHRKNKDHGMIYLTQKRR